MDVSIEGAIFLKGIRGRWKISVYQMCGGADFPYLSCPIPLPQPCPSAALSQRGFALCSGLKQLLMDLGAFTRQESCACQ